MPKNGVSPALLGALINQVAVPELVRWLAGLHAAGKVVTEAEALAKLNLDIDAADDLGASFLAGHQ